MVIEFLGWENENVQFVPSSPVEEKTESFTFVSPPVVPSPVVDKNGGNKPEEDKPAPPAPVVDESPINPIEAIKSLKIEDYITGVGLGTLIFRILF